MKRFALLTVALGWPSLALAASLPPIEMSASARVSTMFVTVTVNGRVTEEIVPMRVEGEKLIVDLADMRKVGLLLEGQGRIDIKHIAGLEAMYDAGGQSLILTAAPALLPVQHVKAESDQFQSAIANHGVMMNYTLYAQRSAGGTQAAMWSEERIFDLVGGCLFTNGTLRLTHSGAGPRFTRYDTRFQRDDEEHSLRYAIGDLITRSLTWSTSVRMGGVQVTRDFRLRPDLVTMPLPSFAGNAAVPSSVDLFVDGYRRQGADVQPGRFVLDDVPVINGAGQATIVTTDATGRQIRTTIPFYVAPELIRPGMSDFAGEVGFLRRSYGLKNFSYGPMSVSGSIRRGMTEHFTVEGHAEGTKNVQVAGVGGVWSPGLLGTVSASAVESNHDGQQGNHWTIAYSYHSHSMGIALQHDGRSKYFRDLSNFNLADFKGTRTSDRIIGTLNLRRTGSFGAAFFMGRSWSGSRSSVVSASYSRPFGRSASLFASVDRDLRNHSTSAQLRVVIPLGANMVGAGLTHTASRGLVSEFDYDRSPGLEGGLGIDANVAVDHNGHTIGQATAIWHNDTIALDAGGSVVAGRSSFWGGASGSIVYMDHSFFAADQVSDAFVVVKTDRPGVPVTYENQPVGKTNKKGDLLVPDVVSFVPVRFAIDTLDLSAEEIAVATENHAKVRAKSGAIVKLTIRKVRNATIYLSGRDGQPLAAGGRVTRDGHADSEIGWDGMVYMEDVAESMPLKVTRRDGSTCSADVTIPRGSRALPKIGPVPCV